MHRSRLLHLARATSASVALVLGAAPAQAQDSQYWSIQYGPVGQQLGGQVVGSTRDLSASFYNPGGLALGEDPHFLLSVQGFRVHTVTVEPAGGGDDPLLDRSQTDFDSYPGFVSFALPSGWLGQDGRFAFSLLTRQQYNAHVDLRVAGSRVGSNDGFELLFDQRMHETWGGLTVSHKISDRLGLGGTLYGVYRGQRTRWEQNLQLANVQGRAAAALVVDDFQYSDWGMLGKLGLAWEGSAVRLGLAVTTPRLALFGSGDIGYTRSAVGADLNGDGQPDSITANGYDKDVDSTYKSAWAVAGGGAWRRRSLQLHASVEWFAAVDQYDVLQGSATAAGQPVRLVQQLDDVLNFGVGAEYWLGGRTVDQGSASWGTVLFGAFSTDNSTAPGVITGEASINSQDWVHITGGVGFRVGASRLSLGLDYAFGSQERELGQLGLQVPGFPTIVEGRQVATKSTRWVLSLGYSFDKN